MDLHEVLQTVGICLNSVFLLLIVLMLARLGSFFLPPTQEELDELEEELNESDPLMYVRGKSREEIHEMLTRPLPSVSKDFRSKSRRK